MVGASSLIGRENTDCDFVSVKACLKDRLKVACVKCSAVKQFLDSA